jgi:glycosyltransferase involved in cell wall biosynthesis
LFDLHYYTFSKNILRFERLFKSSEITHALSPIYTANWFKKNEVPLVTHFYHRDEPKKISDYLFMPFHHKIEKRSYSLSNAIITPSIASKKALIEKYKIVENLIYVVPFGVNIEAFGIEKKSEPEEFKDEIVLLFVGPLIPRKGLLFLIKALPMVLEKHKNVKLILVGEGSQKGDLVKEIEKFGIREYVDFTGYLDGWGEKLTRYYERADIFVFPSLKEGLPQAVIEAMAHRKPVIYLDIPPLVETVGDAGIPVEPKNPRALAEAIVKLIEDKNLRKELGRKGRKRVEKNFTWDIMTDRILKIYEEVLAK